jgi:hypothetical protein
MDEQEANGLQQEEQDLQPQKELNPEEAEMLARFQEEIRRMTVGDHLATMVQSLATLAVRKMGINQETLAEKDLSQAQLGIDALAALLPVLERSRPEQEVAAYRNMISELRMAYVTANQG